MKQYFLTYLLYFLILGGVFSQITYNSVQTGGFLDANTWDQPAAPVTTSNNIINIKAGHTVNINSLTVFSGTTIINIESGGILMANFSNIQFGSNAHLINQGTFNTDAQIVVGNNAIVDNHGIINLNATIGIGMLIRNSAVVNNENTINLPLTSSIQLADPDNVFTNNGVINISTNSIISLNDGVFLTCDPEPIFNNGSNGSRIFDDGDASLIAAEACFVAPIPTIGEWGVLLITLISLILGVVVIKYSSVLNYIRN